jgi:hypothetical protein
MGCDIHLFVEVRDGGAWRPVKVAWDMFGRNYDLFAILAGVRNGCGFAGSVTGTGFVPISEPRGLPADLSVELAAVRDFFDDARVDESGEDAIDEAMNANFHAYGCSHFGDHSFSWISLRDLLSFDWAQTTHKAIYERAKDGWVPLGDKPSGFGDPITYKDCAPEFYETFVPRLSALGYAPDDVRIVFGFDS